LKKTAKRFAIEKVNL